MSAPGEARGASRARLATLILGGLALAAGFSALGIWQIERRAWKLDLIDRVERRLAAAPVEAPAMDAWPSVDGAGAEYLRVRLDGVFDHSRETFVQAATAYGAGYWVLTPLRTERGFTALVNRGFVAPDRREASSRAEGLVAGRASVTGLLRLTEPHGAFLRENDPAADLWRSRDVAGIAEKRALEGPVAPYFVDADARPNPGGLPIGGLTVVAFRNNHLVYALTWFALAALTIGCAAIVVRKGREGS